MCAFFFVMVGGGSSMRSCRLALFVSVCVSVCLLMIVIFIACSFFFSVCLLCFMHLLVGVFLCEFVRFCLCAVLFMRAFATIDGGP